MNLVFVLLILQTFAYAQDYPAGLKEYSTAFNKIEAGSFVFLDNKLSDVRIVGLGEDTHGSADLSQALVR